MNTELRSLTPVRGAGYSFQSHPCQGKQMMKKKGKSTGIEASLLEVEVFKSFVATGDVTGFLALADACDAGEEGVGRVRSHFAQLLRAVAFTPNPAVHWFYVHGEKSHAPEVESELQGHLRSAARLAWFEAKAFELVKSGAWRYEWRPDYEAGFYHDRTAYVLWMCRLDEVAPVAYGHGPYFWRHLNSLGGIDLGENGQPPALITTGAVLNHAVDPHPYCRVVMALLARGTLVDRSEPIPTWLSLETTTA